MPRHHCRLITELVAFKQAEGAAARDLARELGIDETALARYRSGERSPTKRVLAKITERYGSLRFVRDLVWHHLAAECREDYVDPQDTFSGVELPADSVAELRSFVVRLPDELLGSGRGLYIVSADAASLSAAMAAMARAIGAKRIRTQAFRGDARLDARAVRAALAAPVVLIERVDFAAEAVTDIIRRRADLMRPSIVTSMQVPEDVADPYVRRIALSVMHRVEIPSSRAQPQAPSHSTALHDAA